MTRLLLSVALFLLGASLPAQTDTSLLHVVHLQGCDTTITLARLKQLPAHTTTVTGHDGEQAVYTGALLWDVLGATCSSITDAPKRTRLGMVVRVEAADDYHVVLALMEADTGFRERPVLLCWERDGQPLDAYYGPLHLIVPDDLRHARNVRMVKALRVLAP